MTPAPENIRVRLLDREFQVACPPGEATGLRRAAELLDARMREAREEGLVGLDRIAVAVALNLAHEHIELEERAADAGGTALERLRALNRRLAFRLTGNEEPAEHHR